MYLTQSNLTKLTIFESHRCNDESWILFLTIVVSKSVQIT